MAEVEVEQPTRQDTDTVKIENQEEQQPQQEDKANAQVPPSIDVDNLENLAQSVVKINEIPQEQIEKAQSVHQS